MTQQTDRLRHVAVQVHAIDGWRVFDTKSDDYVWRNRLTRDEAIARANWLNRLACG